MASRRSAPLIHPEQQDIDLSRVMAALSDPVRLGIVSALDGIDRGVPCCSLEVPVGKSTASHHFRVLREAGVLRQSDEGTRRMNQVRRADLDARFPGLLDLALAHGREAPVQVR
ncbi:helix-turn-helix transcriptional regulator [Allobranchiibius sp. GilTou73]|uniref:ArsR/SmtB family transcription factor n=1 Tax=Allobranchiibius sp. GilTou73 TaxID=2904523 RepID=UPI001F21C771|nr:helix-turn-helix domain-containing protein [Allobranchiibius sp. GilTou73]UIJ34386.1 helix-turn-helix domain-containing protein [Allobranchiibius sp. GilTou73]